MLALSDDGHGMERETLKKIFEPFFTTKELGRGTGLGLATVYGIVKQNNGFVNVYSEPNKGTTFRIYLPRHAGPVTEPQKESEEKMFRGQGETVLVVEDDVSFLRLVATILHSLGCVALTADSPEEAIRIAKSHPGEIQLLMTDVVMPKMNGRELAQLLQPIRPQMKILFISGYTADVIAHRGVLDKEMHFLSKPFSTKDLAVKLHELLEQI